MEAPAVIPVKCEHNNKNSCRLVKNLHNAILRVGHICEFLPPARTPILAAAPHLPDVSVDALHLETDDKTIKEKNFLVLEQPRRDIASHMQILRYKNI